MPSGVQGRGARRLAEGQQTQVGGVQAVGVLGRVDGRHRLVEVEAGGDRVLDEVAVDGRVGVELGDGGQQVGLGGVGRDAHVDRRPCRSARTPRASWPRSRRWPGRRRPGRWPARPSARPRPAWRPARRRRRARRRPRARRASGSRAQCWNCLSPVNTMTRPCSSAAAMTSSSRTEPPGWMTAATPAAAHRVEAVPEREEGVAGGRAALGPAGGPGRGDLAGRDPVLLAAADADGHAAGGQHDGVGLDRRRRPARPAPCPAIAPRSAGPWSRPATGPGRRRTRRGPAPASRR